MKNIDEMTEVDLVEEYAQLAGLKSYGSAKGLQRVEAEGEILFLYSERDPYRLSRIADHARSYVREVYGKRIYSVGHGVVMVGGTPGCGYSTYSYSYAECDHISRNTAILQVAIDIMRRENNNEWK